MDKPKDRVDHRKKKKQYQTKQSIWFLKPNLTELFLEKTEMNSLIKMVQL